MRGIFVDQLGVVDERIRELEAIRRKIASRIAQIDQAVEGPLGGPELVHLPERAAAWLARRMTPSSDLDPLVRELGHRTGLNDAIFLGKVAVTVSEADLGKRRFDHREGVLILVEGEAANGVTDVILPASTYACLRYRGKHEEAGLWYARLLDFIDGQGLEVCGDSVEVTLVDAGMTPDESQWVTELQVPVIGHGDAISWPFVSS